MFENLNTLFSDLFSSVLERTIRFIFQITLFFVEVTTVHVVTEIIIIFMLLKLFFSSYHGQLSLIEEMKENINKISQEEFIPLPLVCPNKYQNESKKIVIDSTLSTKCILQSGKSLINFGSFDFLGIIGDKEIENGCKETIKKYGIGACGPRGFYGTIDIHIFLEKELAKFLNVEEVIIYSYGFSTIASAIPPYSRNGDIIFCDEGVSFATQTGLLASRSKLKWFSHNNMEHLETLLLKQEEEDKKNVAKANHTKRLIVVEGLYTNYGDICPLPKLIELKKRFKARIFIEESNSFGVLGKTGRGVSEHFNVDIECIDQIISSMETGLGSVGGFCAGSKYVIDHQRLQGKGYCFSAALPAINTQAARIALNKLDKNSNLVSSLSQNIHYFRKQLEFLNKELRAVGDRQSPIIHLQISSPLLSWKEKKKNLQRISDFCLEKEILLSVAKYIEDKENKLPEPSIRIIITAKHKFQEIDNLITTLNVATNSVCPNV